MSLTPIHQFILDGSIQDLGSNPTTVTSEGTTHINYEGKDCVYINSDSSNPAISIPFVVSNTDSFTISFWMYEGYTSNWNLPIGLDNGNGSEGIIEYGTGQNGYINPIITENGFCIQTSQVITGWVHHVITYTNNHFVMYMNDVQVLDSIAGWGPRDWEFTVTRINIGGNNAFAGWNFGAQSSCQAYIRQLCAFDSALSASDVSTLYSQTQGNDVLGSKLVESDGFNLYVSF